jgi:60 kDa SS-A/Ro ribonucleoprotein
VALKQYSQGGGLRSSKTWPVNQQIVNALDDAFYLSFANVEPTGKQHLLCVDVSGSMKQSMASGILTTAEAAAAMALVTARTEPETIIMLVDTQVKAITIDPRQRLDDVMKTMEFRGGGTYLGMAAEAAAMHNVHPDVMIYYTDNAMGSTDDWAQISGLRKLGGDKMKVASVAMTATNFSMIPKVPWAYNLVGFSADLPVAIRALTKGDV